MPIHPGQPRPARAGARRPSSRVPVPARRRRARRGVIAAALALTPAAAAAPAAEAAQQAFASRPDLKPSVISVVKQAEPTVAPGLVFAGQKNGGVTRGGVIYDNAGQVVYFKPPPKGGSRWRSPTDRCVPTRAR
jgi:hypothetical protein